MILGGGDGGLIKELFELGDNSPGNRHSGWDVKKYKLKLYLDKCFAYLLK